MTFASGDNVSNPGAVSKTYNASLGLNYRLFDGLSRHYNFKILNETYTLSELQARSVIENTLIRLASLFLANKEIEKARKRFGDTFNEEEYKTTNPRVMGYLEKSKTILTRLNTSLTNGNLEDVKNLIEELEIACPESGSRNWTDVREFNLMFNTQLGTIAGEAGKLYLRPR